MTTSRQRQLLGGLLVVLAAVVGWRVLAPVFGGGKATPTGTTGAVALSDLRMEDVEVLRLGDLDLEAAEFQLGRDPFRFDSPPQPAPVAPAPVAVAPPRSRPPAAAATNRQPPAAQPPPVDVVYLGRFGPSGRSIAVFSDGKEIFNVLEGGVIKGHFVVDKIGYESADLTFVGFPDAPAQRLAVGG